MKRVIITILLSIIIATIGINICLADRPPIIPAGTSEALNIPSISNQQLKDKNTTPEQYVQGVVLPTLTQTIIALAGGLSFLFIIIGGIQILTAYGNEESLSNGRKTVTFAIVGLVISLLSYAIVSIISSVQIGEKQGQSQSQSNQESK